jgi:hypothetical protein
MEYTGYADPRRPRQVVIRGDLHAREFIASWLRERSVVAGMNVNIWDLTEPITHLIRSAEWIAPA